VAVAAPDSFRVVLDTSVLVRGILSSRGPSGYILESFLDGAFELVLSLSIIAEAESVLNRRHIRARPSFNAEDSHDLLVALVEASHVASGTYYVNLVPTDAKDNHIVSTALEGGAGTIVTEDARDLLSLKVIKIRGFPPVQIVDAKAFARQLRQSR
jgi:putative PIN family toxin of toxin-antitoxin system